MSRESFIASIAGHPRRASIKQIVRDVAAAYGEKAEDILGRDRKRKFVIPRQEVMRRAYEAGLSLPQIGRAMGRDHTTVLHGISRAKERRNIKDEVK